MALKIQPKPKKTKAPVRSEILDRIRCEGEEAATCFKEPEIDVEAEPADLEAILAEILDGLEPHDVDLIREAAEELTAESDDARAWFGADDQLMHPSTDIYADPVDALGDPPLYLDLVNADDFDYPIVLNQRTQDWMVYFLTRGRRWYVRWLARAERYRPLVVPKLREAGLPEDLLYQSMIESGFNPYATSHASAVGIWQFISSTGKAYGLQNNWWVDERRDPVMATDSAIRFMSDLHKRFDHWHLASAAYNAGPGKISRAIDMYGTEDFWEMSASGRNYLKPETKNYVPKIMAAAILAKYADRYGLTEEIKPDDVLDAWAFDTVSVPEATDLRVAADILGLTVEQVEAMNPALRRGYTPPGVANYSLNIPLGTSETFAAAFKKIPQDERTTFVRYKVRRGDTLGQIASKFDVPSKAVQRMNGIKDPRKLRVGQRLLIPVRAEALGSREITHVVAKGETLSVIGKKYGMSVAQLRERNGITGDVLRIGQKLTVLTAGEGDAKPTATVRTASASSASDSAPAKRSTSGAGPKTTWHTVSRGDSLYEIATKHGTSVSELRRLNKFGSKHVLHPGDRVRLRPDPPVDPTTRYAVKSGDTLSTIASRYGMTTKELMRINSLTSDRISVGQKLKVVASGRGGSPVVHTVARGDTLSQIAEKYRTSVDSIQTGNSIRGTSISVGQKLTVYPGNGGTGASERTIDYQVQSGDTLGAISKKYGVSVDELMAWNELRGDTIRPGQRLRVILR
ncbi:MAG: LysM peptidoglycan-binding domain-containing protein [Proteobacteria bacterium]|nr:LysM peptidoglycan-binding domain-containing protein [Pseudomonadota bacterium]